MQKIIITAALILLASSLITAQQTSSSEADASDISKYDQERLEVFNILQQKDSLLFKLGFNNCDTAILRNLVSDDFEFYHDQSGFMNSKDIFIQGIARLCHMNYKATRELKEHSLEVYLLKNKGQLYGAIQKGEHEFYGEEKDKPKYLTSTAKFTHIWILKDGSWLLKRVLSYDHVVPKN